MQTIIETLAVHVLWSCSSYSIIMSYFITVFNVNLIRYQKAKGWSHRHPQRWILFTCGQTVFSIFIYIPSRWSTPTSSTFGYSFGQYVLCSFYPVPLSLPLLTQPHPFSCLGKGILITSHFAFWRGCNWLVDRIKIRASSIIS